MGPEELVHAFAKESKSSQSLPVDKVDVEAQEARQRAALKTGNLQAYVAWFNRLSFLVATSVCQVSSLQKLPDLLKYPVYYCFAEEKEEVESENH